jgi:hypothetical protein
MILFDLMCEDGHGFEGWFPDSKSFAQQCKKGIVSCPTCGSAKVEKALQAPAVSTSRKKEASTAKRQMAAAMNMLQEVRREVEKSSDFVGDNFAEEARKIHYGESKKRDIHGQTTADEAKELNDEGVDFTVVPWVDLPENKA